MNYQKIYNQIIERAKSRKFEEYKERHHIIPRCIGGDDSKENIVELTAREHFLCHMLLCEIYPNNIKLTQALWLMIIGKNSYKNIKSFKISSRIYEINKIKFSNLMKQRKLTDNEKNIIGKKNSKPVYQYDLNGNFIKKWESVSQAERYFQGDIHWTKLISRISACCLGRNKTAHGFIWKYNKKDVDINILKWKGKKIIQVAYDGSIIKIFDTINEAKTLLNLSNHKLYKLLNNNFLFDCKKNKRHINQLTKDGYLVKTYSCLNETKKDGFSPKSIVNVLNKKSKSSGGFIWEYQQDDKINYTLKFENN